MSLTKGRYDWVALGIYITFLVGGAAAILAVNGLAHAWLGSYKKIAVTALILGLIMFLWQICGRRNAFYDSLRVGFGGGAFTVLFLYALMIGVLGAQWLVERPVQRAHDIDDVAVTVNSILDRPGDDQLIYLYSDKLSRGVFFKAEGRVWVENADADVDAGGEPDIQKRLHLWESASLENFISRHVQVFRTPGDLGLPDTYFFCLGEYPCWAANEENYHIKKTSQDELHISEIMDTWFQNGVVCIAPESTWVAAQLDSHCYMSYSTAQKEDNGSKYLNREESGETIDVDRAMFR